MPRALPDDYRPAQRIGVGYEICPAYRDWAEVVGKDHVGDYIRFTLAEGEPFNAYPTQRILSRRLPRESS